ncbi:FIVAR domain-containing protein [Mycoplasma tullyi]|uniref:FIVAR domain-containing protein n=1 Tax=Mycoplasma tullyi TaxID=1612150 RepID=A0A7D7XUK0_9MOLU|nr:FIVAR domain-containing protein [Mycoplasma tullyi]QMT98274.1 FIVAR domain-containing protein [Mycoplasma tullyi]
MKRKNILKFVSLLGVGSFVALAAASCTQAVVPVPTSKSNIDSNSSSPNPKPSSTDPKSSSTNQNPSNTNSNPSSSAGDTGKTMSDNTNSSMNTVNPELASARMTLTTLINGEANNLASYDDYAKIKSNLMTAYQTAKEVSTKTDATITEINDANSALDSAIKNAINAKDDFNSKNEALVTAYNALKTTFNTFSQTLESLSADKYSGIKKSLTNVYDQGKAIITKTLDPVDGMIPVESDITRVNNDITTATESSKLTKEKQNADMFGDGFVKQVLNSQQLTAPTTVSNTQQFQQQPGNYSFVGYSVDVSSGSNSMTPNWNFAQRKIWNNNSGNTTPLTDATENSQPLTDVSWIYSLSGEGAKYSLSFEYYGPSTGYLYFPYKLVKNSDSENIGLQYKLNESEQPVAITFGSSETDSGDKPTVSDIKVAKIKLTNLIFGTNKLEFSVPTNKVAPMIGNMYLTSSLQNQNKVYDAIFGNTISTTTDSTSIEVDILKGYSLTSSWQPYFGKFTGLMMNSTTINTPIYLVGLVGGNQNRTIMNSGSITNTNNFPTNSNSSRTFTIYVNAPMAGDYYVSGDYLSKPMRGLKFSSGQNNDLIVKNVMVDNWSTLRRFNTKTDNMTERAASEGSTMKRTLKLNEGLNAITLTGVDGVDNGDTPFIGNLTFTLMNASSTIAPENGTTPTA